MARPCICENVTGPVYTPEQCRRCWKWRYDAAYRNAHGGGRVQLPCVHLLPATGERRPCPSCGGNVEVKLFGCAMHGTCTTDKHVLGVACCRACPDRCEPPANAPITRRNLIFHLYPLKNNNVWRWHLKRWRKAFERGIFNGKRVAALAIDDRTEPPLFIERECQKAGFTDVFSQPNDTSLREVATFQPLMERVQSVAVGEATLYAQGKGVQHNRPHGDDMSREWRHVLHELYVDHWTQMTTLLRKYPVAGAFLKQGQVWPVSASTWHYSGSWFWFRNRDLFFKDWQKIEQFWSGIEAYPSLHFRHEEAASLLLDEPAERIGLYLAINWRDVIDPALAAFRADPWKNIPRFEDNLKVEIGGGIYPRGDGFINVDRLTTGIDLEADSLPFSNDSVAELYSSHCFEHIRNLQHLLHEVVRVCKVGAAVEIRVPHWLDPMAMCHDHKQVIPPEQVQHWCETALEYWWKGCSKRFRFVSMEQIPSAELAAARRLHPGVDDETIMRFVPGAADEVRYRFEVVPL